MDQEGAVALEHEEPDGLRKPSGEAACVDHFAAGDEQTHKRATVLSVSDRGLHRSGGRRPVLGRLFLLSGALFCVLCATAAADVGPPRLSRATGKPGQVVIGRGPSGMPVLMIPARL